MLTISPDADGEGGGEGGTSPREAHEINEMEQRSQRMGGLFWTIALAYFFVT
jgi:hypothetical protein